MKQAILISTGLLLITPFIHAEKNKDKKPNVVFILADDLGYGDLSCYGQEKFETPNIDKLAQSGMRFTQCYSGTTVSAPSRSCLLTGTHSGHTPVRGNLELDPEGQFPLPDDARTIFEVMKDAGYKTSAFGKWGLGYIGSTGDPKNQGCDTFYGYNCQREAHTYYPPFLYRNEHREYLNNPLVVPHTKLDKGADPYEEKSYAKYTLNEYAPDLMYKEILNFIDLTKDNPFVLFWTTPLPHVPLQAPEKWVKHYVNKFGDEKPYTGNKDYFPCRYPRATYAAMISYWDEQIGGLINKLKELGIYDNTIIIFTSDNGPTFNGGSDSFFFDSAKPFKSEWGWGKASLREGGIRVPMIASWPKKIKAGSKSDLICAFWDIMPTFCEIAKVECPTTDGISFLPELLGKKQNKHDFLYWEFPDSGGQKAVRMGKWKGIVLNIFKGNRKIQLYDLDSDPREQTDVARYHPEIVKRMEDIMKQEHIEPELASFKMPH